MTFAKRASVLIGLLLVMSACSPKKDDSTPGGGSGAPVSQGTGSLGGGGNGIDEKMLESFAFSIETLPEYRRYIEPIIRKIGRGQSEVFRNYMIFGVKKKIWYMIPRPLSDLSQDQIGTGFSTEQYALNNDQRVYIAKGSFLKMDHKERANLLMHEIVMSARLLMKKTPKEQCDKLPDAQISKCNDPEMMKIAEAVDISEGERGRMDTQDHDAVRAMTIFLMQNTSDVSAATVSAKRRELGFVFPWDKAVSNLTINDLRLAIVRAQLSGETFVPNKSIRPFMKPVDLRCSIDQYAYNDEELSLQIDASLAQDVDANFDAFKLPADYQPIFRRMGWKTLANQNRMQYYSAAFEEADAIITNENFEARGILDPANPKRVVDLIRTRPILRSEDVVQAIHRGDQWPLSQIEFIVSRDEVPRILRISVKRLAVNFLKPDQDERVITPGDWEYVVNQKELFSCTPAVLANRFAN